MLYKMTAIGRMTAIGYRPATGCNIYKREKSIFDSLVKREKGRERESLRERERERERKREREKERVSVERGRVFFFIFTDLHRTDLSLHLMTFPNVIKIFFSREIKDKRSVTKRRRKRKTAKDL